MLPASRDRILARLEDRESVLDVGGGANPFERADWVIDLMAYADRGLYGQPPDPGRERFTAQTWVQRDICAREPWPFTENQFAFAVCSHTLEDVRDPVWVCAELARVARAGYIEVPSRLEEQSVGVHGPWPGWSHHRWLVDADESGLSFVFKPHAFHARPSALFPHEFWAALSPEQRVIPFWWEGEFAARERVFSDADSLDAYLDGFVARHQVRRESRKASTGGLFGRRRNARTD